MDVTNVFERNLKAFLAGNTLIINPGGTSSSKTYSLIQLLIMIAHRRKYTISVVSETMPHLKKGAMKDFLDVMKGEGLYDEKYHNKSDNVYQFNNGKIEFFSADTPSKVHGPRRDILYVNEAINVPWPIYDHMNIRTNICTFLDFNPCGEFWAHERLQPGKDEKGNDKGIIWLHSTYKDNQFLPDKIIKDIESREFTDPEWWKVYGLGEIGRIEGAIFENWKQVPEIPKDAKRLGFGLDFGFSVDPAVIVEVFMQDGELWVRELLYETGMTNRDLSKKMEEVGIVRGIDEIWADSAEPKSIKELRDAGWLIRGAAKGVDSVRKGIDVIKQYPINVTSDSLNMIREFRYYKWQRDKKTDKPILKPESGWDHCMDAFRYLCTSKLKKPRKFLRQWN
ncbi:MAG: phage terminase large subunit [Bacteroidales bacterium]|nr:phage terminase large subunit [Bacteroidales bacterium]